MRFRVVKPEQRLYVGPVQPAFFDAEGHAATL